MRRGSGGYFPSNCDFYLRFIKYYLMREFLKKKKVTAESYFLLQLHMLLRLGCRASFNRDLHQKLDAFTAQGVWGEALCVYASVWGRRLGEERGPQNRFVTHSNWWNSRQK